VRDIPLLVGFLIMLGVTLVRPWVGVLVWCWTALLVPNFYVFGIAYDVRFNFWIAALTLFSWLVSKEPKHIPLSGTVVLLALFTAVATISSLFSISPAQDMVWISFDKFVKTMTLTLITIALINTEARIKALVFAIALSMGFHGVVEASKWIMSAGGHKIWGPGSSVIGDNNHFALAAVMMVPILIYLFGQTRNTMVRFVLAAGMVLQVITVVGTASRGGLLGVLALGLWIFVTTKRKLKFMIVALPVAVAALAIAPQTWYDRMETIQTADQDVSFMGRVIAWKINTLVALDHPFIGGGFRATEEYAVWSDYSRKFALLDFVPTDQPDINAHAAHSIYFQVLGDMGFLGLAIFVGLLMAAWRNSWITMTQTRNRPDMRWAHDLAKTLQYALVPYMVSGAALNMAYFELAYVVLALLAVLRRITAVPSLAPFAAGSAVPAAR